jgi:hypothetical protein
MGKSRLEAEPPASHVLRPLSLGVLACGWTTPAFPLANPKQCVSGLRIGKSGRELRVEAAKLVSVACGWIGLDWIGLQGRPPALGCWATSTVFIQC